MHKAKANTQLCLIHHRLIVINDPSTIMHAVPEKHPAHEFKYASNMISSKLINKFGLILVFHLRIRSFRTSNICYIVIKQIRKVLKINKYKMLNIKKLVLSLFCLVNIIKQYA